MNKHQEALSSISFTLHYRVKPKTLGRCEDENLDLLQELVDKVPHYEKLEERAKPPKDFDEAMKFHMLELQEHLGAIAKLQETFTYNELGSIHYKLNEDTVEEYLNRECEFAIKEVIENLDCYLDWSDFE